MAEIDGTLVRVQVKTSRARQKDRWVVALRTRGGNRSWNGIIKRMDAGRCDYLLVHVADGRRWFIPSHAVDGSTAICLGGPKYAQYEVDRGPPLVIGRAAPPALECSAPTLWRDTQAVNGTAL